MNADPTYASPAMVTVGMGAPTAPVPPVTGTLGYQPAPPPPMAFQQVAAPDYSAALENFRLKYEINPKYAAMLQKIANYQSVIIADDSGSMNDIAEPDTDSSVTRWQELKQTLQIIVEAHAVFDLSCDIYFINRGFVRNVRQFSEVQPYLVENPHGGTNTLNILNMISANYVGVDMGKPLILHILTDGHPTNVNGQEDMNGVAVWLRNRPMPKKFPVSIILCTDDEGVERAYRALEFNPKSSSSTAIPGVDVSADYRGEAREVRETRGRGYRFSFGDYIVKFLVGSIDPTIHDIDLVDSGCCVIN